MNLATARCQKRPVVGRFRHYAVGAALAMLALGVAATPASASKRQAFASMGANADGYRFDLSVPVGAGPRGVGVSFYRENEATTEAEGAFYRVGAAGSYANRRISADLGPLGSVRARFVVTDEHHQVRRHGKHCAEVETRLVGRFEGRIDVEGENGFAAVHRTAIPGRMRSYRIRGCSRHRARPAAAPSASHTGLPVPPKVLRADSPRQPAVTACGTDLDTWFAAVRGPTGTQYGASYETREGGIHAVRLAFSRGPRDSFVVAPSGRRATVDADAHFFAGTGRYSQGRLTGDLTADLPGQPGIPVTPAEAWFGGADDIDPGPCYPFAGD